MQTDRVPDLTIILDLSQYVVEINDTHSVRFHSEDLHNVHKVSIMCNST